MATKTKPKKPAVGAPKGNQNAAKAPEDRAPAKRAVSLRFSEEDYRLLDRRAELAGKRLGPYLTRECLRLVRDIEAE